MKKIVWLIVTIPFLFVNAEKLSFNEQKQILETEMLKFTSSLTKEEIDFIPLYLRQTVKEGNDRILKCKKGKKRDRIVPIAITKDNRDAALKENEKVYKHNALVYSCIQLKYFNLLVKETFKNKKDHNGK